MRILVISDSHGRASQIEKAIEARPDAKDVFFLGDCVDDIEDMPFIYPDRVFHIVCGNCDGQSMYKSEDSVTLGGKKIFFTHGHTYSVKSGNIRLWEKARGEGFDIVLYGHTHVAKCEYENGIYLINPGSISRPAEGRASYAVVDIVPGGVMPIITEL